MPKKLASTSIEPSGCRSLPQGDTVPMRIVVVAHDPAWRTEFEEEAKHISRVLGDRVSRLHHIGSTAIPGIFAKPVIDLLMEVENIVELDARNSAMEGLGYESMGEFRHCRPPLFSQEQCLWRSEHTRCTLLRQGVRKLPGTLHSATT